MKTHQSRERGATLVEIIVTVAVLAVGLYAIGTGLQAARVGGSVTKRTATAQLIAGNVLEMLQTQGEELRPLLQGRQSVVIPPQGPKVWQSDSSFQWTASVERVPDMPLARVEVKVSPTKGAPETALATATGLIVLNEGGGQ